LQGALSAGFLLPCLKLAVLTDSEVLGARKIRRPRRVARQGQRITSLSQLTEGDYVVHLHHGIGRYRGLVTQNVDGAAKDYLHLEYADNTRLYVPVDQIDRVTRYIGSDDHPPQIHRIGGTEWMQTKRRARAKVREMAKELVELYAARQAAQGYAFSPDTPWQREMEESFIYEETPDQLTAIREMKEGMERPQPMDRLICGDVGYGKTEVAIRGAFKAVMDGKQVAVLVPTTVLAQQHFNTFTERLAAFPVRVEMLSRFRSPRDQARVVKGLREGTVDIVIGTHRLLSKDVAFRDLGLVIVDEEQRFGVAHKERLKQLRTSVDVLTLTATPIPRTLHMSLSGIRDMSTISDPPEGRTAIRTYCVERNDELIRDAILRELDRDGQVYFVHNRVETIEAVAQQLQNLVPQARFAIGHGQMPEGRLEKVMLDFYDRRYDVLVCTTIIESGLDIPNVNTILIDNAPHMGLAQLYQLRGRVGRSPRQAYCYLLFDPKRLLTETAEKRLDAIREFTQLGSGFQVALRDLEIRGAGNLLGAEQHGFMLSVGFELYCRMIEEAVKSLRGEEVT
ncbi:MAG TPA: transcription-repair coupling factor, partial [Armatimonadota bacterium]|nr:transcription-repair coupling factor [Armatimonadota bacterium]